MKLGEVAGAAAVVVVTAIVAVHAFVAIVPTLLCLSWLLLAAIASITTQYFPVANDFSAICFVTFHREGLGLLARPLQPPPMLNGVRTLNFCFFLAIVARALCPFSDIMPHVAALFCYIYFSHSTLPLPLLLLHLISVLWLIGIRFHQSSHAQLVVTLVI
jgi:hypothetical protein